MADYSAEIQQVMDSEESKDLVSTIDGEVVSTERQLKNGTIVYKEPNNKTWLIYPNGYIRVGRPHADRLSQVHKPDGEHNYDNMGQDYYTDFAIPLIKEKYLNIKSREAKRWEKISNNSHKIIPAFFERGSLQKLIIKYFNGDVDFNRLYYWLKEI